MCIRCKYQLLPEHIIKIVILGEGVGRRLVDNPIAFIVSLSAMFQSGDSDATVPYELSVHLQIAQFGFVTS